MATRHVVSQGECVASIAYRYGFADEKALHDHPANAEFKRKRPDPNVLHPGDEIVIPDRQLKTLTLATGTVHKIVVKIPKRKIQVRLEDDQGEPLTGRAFRLSWVNGKPITGKTGSDGIIRGEVPITVTTATLKTGPTVRRLQLGGLNPMRETDDGGVTGVQARLANLGYGVGAVDGSCGPRTTAAIEEFQRHAGLAVTGTIDESLIAALEKAHGC